MKASSSKRRTAGSQPGRAGDYSGRPTRCGVHGAAGCLRWPASGSGHLQWWLGRRVERTPLRGESSRASVERKLRQVSDRLRQLHEELNVTDEQLQQLADEAEDARLRALVSETPLAGEEHRQAARHAEAMRRHRAHIVEEIQDLERAQDDLLDKLVAESRD